MPSFTQVRVLNWAFYVWTALHFAFLSFSSFHWNLLVETVFADSHVPPLPRSVSLSLFLIKRLTHAELKWAVQHQKLLCYSQFAVVALTSLTRLSKEQSWQFIVALSLTRLISLPNSSTTMLSASPEPLCIIFLQNLFTSPMTRKDSPVHPC